MNPLCSRHGTKVGVGPEHLCGVPLCSYSLWRPVPRGAGSSNPTRVLDLYCPPISSCAPLRPISIPMQRFDKWVWEFLMKLDPIFDQTASIFVQNPILSKSHFTAKKIAKLFNFFKFTFPDKSAFWSRKYCHFTSFLSTSSHFCES